jgi:hypothetical protein
MASRKKSETPIAEEDVINAIENVEAEIKEESEKIVEQAVNNEEETVKITEKSTKNTQKYEIGSIVFIVKSADADLNGFKLFPQYKKYTYTVEAYDENTGVYSLRRLNLSLKLKETDIVAPNERAHDQLNRKQF